MSQVKISGNASGTGILTVAAPNTNSNYTLTLPAETGTVLTSASSITQNAGPAFRGYYSGSSFSLTNATYTKVQLDAETFDYGSCFDPTTNYRFTPNVAGVYQINFSVTNNFSTTQYTTFNVYLYKNGSELLEYTQRVTAGDYDYGSQSGSDLVYMNGSTDYLELYVYTNGGSGVLYQGAGVGVDTYMSGFLARAT